MAGLLSKKSTYKKPGWIKSVPFKKGTSGYGSQIVGIFVLAIIAMILYY